MLKEINNIYYTVRKIISVLFLIMARHFISATFCHKNHKQIITVKNPLFKTNKAKNPTPK